MKPFRFVPTVGFALALSALSAACSKQPPPPPPAPVPEATPSEDVDADAEARRAREAEEARRRAEEEARRTRAVLEEMVFFDYDRSEIRADARRVLDTKIPVLRDQPGIRMRIEGHADERGSTEYNVALGMRRAESVRQYFVDYGIDGSRFQLLSYGEERPLAAGHDESAWGRNRRAEFVITAGMAVTATRPGAEGR